VATSDRQDRPRATSRDLLPFAVGVVAVVAAQFVWWFLDAPEPVALISTWAGVAAAVLRHSRRRDTQEPLNEIPTRHPT
jgi:hypothetical protein